MTRSRGNSPAEPFEADALRILMERFGTLPEGDFASGARAVLEDFFFGEGKRHTRIEVAQKAGVSVDYARGVWRGLGLPELDDEERVLNDADVEALRRLERLNMVGRQLSPSLDVDALSAQLARLLGSAMSRLAAAEIEVMRQVAREVADPDSRGSLPFDRDGFRALMRGYFDLMKETLDFVHRRHLFSTAFRELSKSVSKEERGTNVTVGFADMVGFTALSQQLDASELANLVSRFAEESYELIAQEGGRVVKMIGDEVMFVTRDSSSAARIALLLTETWKGNGQTLPVRVGLASGLALHHEGDYYGPVVNLASRLVNVALPGTVLVSDPLAKSLEGEPFRLKRLRPLRFKGIGEARAWVLRR